MSRIGKQEILIPAGVEVSINGSKVDVKGPKGSLKMKALPEILIEIKDNAIYFSPKKEDLKSKAYWGLTRTLVSNMVEGVSKGFEKKLEINGVGFKVRLEGKKLILDVGFSHSVEVEAPEGIEFLVEKNLITVLGIDKELVGQVSAKIRRIRPPEPYKGKGIKYLDEIIKRKVGKKTAA
ncbi:MAG: 50S ribosomal protein L6 [Candidatus Pacebacteria bacterium]|nr:50S ribosomal protein L6 [Candidatus Paceibacterota bacterium]MDD4074173.1 50S ribosomal protein L6 [Candidatus Paceibacterota bacterium]